MVLELELRCFECSGSHEDQDVRDPAHRNQLLHFTIAVICLACLGSLAATWAGVQVPSGLTSATHQVRDGAVPMHFGWSESRPENEKLAESFARPSTEKLCLVDSLGKVVSRMRSIKLLGEMGSKATRECVTGMINPAVWERDLH
jgi:hypothetical protein